MNAFLKLQLENIDLRCLLQGLVQLVRTLHGVGSRLRHEILLYLYFDGGRPTYISMENLTGSGDIYNDFRLWRKTKGNI